MANAASPWNMLVRNLEEGMEQRKRPRPNTRGRNHLIGMIKTRIVNNVVVNLTQQNGNTTGSNFKVLTYATSVSAKNITSFGPPPAL